LGGEIEIKLNKAGLEFVNIQVRDTGIGMDSKNLENVFEPFDQGTGETKLKIGGTGLGLSLAKKLAELIGGTLTAESELGKGSTFTLRLPKSPSGSN